MKRNRLALLIAQTLGMASVVGVTPAQAQNCTPPPPGLVSWWPGQESADDNTNNNPGTAENGTTYAPGKVGQAFSFDGVDDFVNVPDSPTLDAITTQITVDFWMRPEQPDKNVWVFARRDPLVSEGFSVLMLPGGELVINPRTTNDLTPVGTHYVSGPIIRFGDWQHVAVTFYSHYPEPGQVTAYVNGNLVPLERVFRPPVYGSLVNVDHLFIGRRQSSDTIEGPVGGGHYVGEIDEVEIYARALTQAEIQAIYSAGSAGKCVLQVELTRP